MIIVLVLTSFHTVDGLWLCTLRALALSIYITCFMYIIVWERMLFPLGHEKFSLRNKCRRRFQPRVIWFLSYFLYYFQISFCSLFITLRSLPSSTRMIFIIFISIFFLLYFHISNSIYTPICRATFSYFDNGISTSLLLSWFSRYSFSLDFPRFTYFHFLIVPFQWFSHFIIFMEKGMK